MTDLIIQGIKIDWSRVGVDSYLRGIRSLRGLEQLNFSSPVTCFVGENGSGKSTLLEAVALAYGFNPEGGSRNYQFSTYDSHSELGECLTLIKGLDRQKRGYFLRAESFYNVASQEEAYFGTQSAAYHRKSHGEAFLAVLDRHCKERGLYLLDEPESALSPQRQLSLLKLIDDGVKAGGQFILVTHSPILLAYPGASLLNFDGEGLTACAYEDTASYQVTKLMLDQPDRILHYLLED